MGRLIYLMNVSLDGFIETPDRGLDWTVVDDELHGWFNEHARGIGASLYGRRIYELMAGYWPNVNDDPAATPVMLEFGAIWSRTPKIVFSSTLQTVRPIDRLAEAGVAEELARVRAEVDGDLEVCGPTLAAEFVRRGLVDEYRLVVHPVAIGGGTPYFPSLDQPLRLRLLETARFSSGAVLLRYETVRDNQAS